FTHWDRSLFFESGKYTLLMFLTSIVAQVNNNLDNVIIGALSGAEFVTVYSMGLLIFAMYENLSTSVSGVMLPTVSNLLEQDNAHEKIVRLIVQAGRVQFSLLGAAVIGFACLGKEFLRLWLGEGFEDVYIITLILMIPSLFELCVNVCISVLRAKNMLTFRTVTLICTTVLNAIITVVSVSFWSYIGAAIGTAVSFVVGSLIIMNVYYKKKLNLPMLKIYGRIFHKIWICLALSGGVLFFSSRFISGSILAFLLNVLIFLAVYAATMLLFGLERSELKHVPILGKIAKNKNQ
ncbi:MAG: oligosaccharide flippase family protein, partial [Clostridia bacterium]|nr:oligosaccharide flippase family protein [Clostridia bacterium]